MPNPYLSQQADAITNQANQNLMNYQLPSINSGAMMAGGFGGSRQGIAQGLAIGQTNQGISNSLANLYGGAYENDQNRALQQSMQQAALNSQQSIAGMNDATQRLGLQNSYNLGLGQLGLGARSADTSQYNAETSRGLGYGQLQQQGDQNAFNNQLAGYNASLNGLGAMQNWNAQGVNMANQQQQLPLQNLGLLSNIGTSIGGQGSSATVPGASTVGSALGGALTAAQLWKLLSGG